jgi:DALR anticodon binding domain
MQLIYPSLSQWCADTIATIIAREGWSKAASIQMPEFRLDKQKRGLVTSPISLWLAARQKSSPEKVGAMLLEQLQQVNVLELPQCWLHPNHWLYLQFSDVALADWLQNCFVTEPRLVGSDRPRDLPSIPNSISANPSIFVLQYAHARCCSLMRIFSETLQIQLPNLLLPWLHAQLLNNLHPAEQNLIHFLLQFPQAVLGQKTIRGIPNSATPGYQSDYSGIVQPSQLQSFCTAFLIFHQDCQIFAARFGQNEDMLRFRLALLQIIQQLLQFSLHHLLGIYAPNSL